MKKLLYFGCGPSEKGHYLFQSDHYSTGNTDPIADQYGINRDLLRKLDGMFTPNLDGQIQGCYQLSFVGTTKYGLIKIVSWWDRTMDSRYGSNSNLIGIGYTSAEEMIDDAYLTFPKIMGRQPRPTIYKPNQPATGTEGNL